MLNPVTTGYQPLAATPDVDMIPEGPPTFQHAMYMDSRSVQGTQNVEIPQAGEAQAVRLATELRFREHEENARAAVHAEMQQLRQYADEAHDLSIASPVGRLNGFAGTMKAELGAAQEALEKGTRECTCGAVYRTPYIPSCRHVREV